MPHTITSTIDSPPAGYRGTTVCAITGITYRQLDYWTRSNVTTASITPAAGSGSQRLYSHRDVLNIALARTLINSGLTLDAVRSTLHAVGGFQTGTFARATLLVHGEDVTVCHTGNDITDTLRRTPAVVIIAMPRIAQQVANALAHHTPDN